MGATGTAITLIAPKYFRYWDREYAYWLLHSQVLFWLQSNTEKSFNSQTEDKQLSSLAPHFKKRPEGRFLKWGQYPNTNISDLTKSQSLKKSETLTKQGVILDTELGHYPNLIITVLEQQDYMESLYNKLLFIKAMQKEEGVAV